MKITLFEDEYALRKNVADFLALHGYDVESYGEGEEMLEACGFDSDLYILDINVPGANGFEVMEWISRNDPGKPVIFMSAFTDIESIARAYRQGCGDYLKKPFDLMELLFRIRKLLSPAQSEEVKIAPEHTFSLRSRQLRFRGETVALSKNQRNILHLLCRHRNRLVTYDLLIEEVWEGKLIRLNTIASHMREIRTAIPGFALRNVRGEGYILEA